MKIDVTLLKFGLKAANEDENYVTREVVEEYLKSDRWAYQKSTKQVLSSITHALRNEPGSEEGLGASDKLFKDGTIVGCLIDSWVSPDGTSWEGTLDIFDDLDSYSESQKPHIMQLLRLLKNDVSVPVSCCILGDWNDIDGKLDNLDQLQGLDFTLNPAFFGSTVKLETIKD